MKRIHFVGDGDRDARTVPHLVETILEMQIESVTFHWARLNSVSGYARKVFYAIASAVNQEADGVVLVVDRDKAQAWRRLGELNNGREDYRQRSSHVSLPAAIGEANPHGEAWLLDDTVAVRQALQLEPSVEIRPIAKTKDPKAHLTELIGISDVAGMKPIDALAAIAQLVDPERCLHTKATGFERFRSDLLKEFQAMRDSRAD
jgi:hypothetical protein